MINPSPVLKIWRRTDDDKIQEFNELVILIIDQTPHGVSPYDV